jgi:EAL domain-containing protein (putative c-di-GMP-specific phosphodiesterase class I)
VLHEACRQLKTWQESGLPWLTMAVNISVRQFVQNDITKMVSEALSTSGINPNCLELELTESIIMNNTDEATAVLVELKKLGVDISVDDFGTGYSSLAYLKRLPLDTLKIDRSFVNDITTDADDAVIVTAIIAMATSLNLKIIAEGVETEEQMNILQQQGANIHQGYFFSKPLDAKEMEKILKASKGTLKIAS